MAGARGLLRPWPPLQLRRGHGTRPPQPLLLPRQLRPRRPRHPLPQSPLASRVDDRLPRRIRRVARAILLPRRAAGGLRPDDRRPGRAGCDGRLDGGGACTHPRRHQRAGVTGDRGRAGGAARGVQGHGRPLPRRAGGRGGGVAVRRGQPAAPGALHPRVTEYHVEETS